MANDETNVVAQNEGEAVTPQANPPQAEVASTEPQTTDANAPVVANELPEATEEQRRAFQELRLENKRLKEESEKRARHENAFDVFRTPQQMVPQQLDVNRFVDPITQEVDWSGYNNAVMTQAQQAAKATAQQTTQEMIDEATARQKYPEAFATQAQEEDIASKYLYRNLIGQRVTVEELAREVAESTKQAMRQAEKQGAERALTEVTAKEQASMHAQAQSSQPARQASSSEDLDRLRVMSRGLGKTSDDAIAQRLSMLGDLKR